MVSNGEQKNSLENTLFTLMEKGTAAGLEQGNLLVMMSLVNLMGIVNLINKRMDNIEEK
jgi:hypothetical protein